MKSIYLDDYKLHDLLDPANKSIISEIQGLEFPEIRAENNTKSGADGIYISNIYTGERRITLNGHLFNAVDAASFVAIRQALAAACRPRRDGNDLPIQRVLRFQDMDNNEYRVLGQVINAKMPLKYVTNAEYQIDFLAETFAIESYTAQNVTLQTYSGGGFVLPVVFPMVFGAGSGGERTVANNGDAEAYPVITVYGSITNPRIENLTTGKFISLNLSLANGEYIIIDMANKTILQGGVTNKIAYKSDDSKFWALAGGENIIRLTSSTSGEPGYCVITYRHAYTGV